MFDPTAFENMKVVLEGALYDLDLNGEIIIFDRNDFINLAKLSRKYEACFSLVERSKNISAKLVLEAGLDNLAAELLPGAVSENRSGCLIYLQFYFEHSQKIINYDKIEKALLDIWGSTRKMTYLASFYPLQKEKRMQSEVKIEFERLIQENQIDDLVEMIDSMITTLYRLQD
jgi:hypothetical protein